MNKDKIKQVKKLYSEYLPSLTLNNEVKLFFPECLIKDKKKHIAVIREIEKVGFLFLRETFEVNGEYIAYFK